MKRRRWMAIPGALVAVTLSLAACVTAKFELPAGPMPFGSRIAVQAAPVLLDPADPSRTSIGDFRFAGGIALTSSQTSRLHGLSDLFVQPNGWLLAVTDDGDRLAAQLVLDRAGRLSGIDHASLNPLTGLGGKPLQGKEQGDAEGVTLLPDGPTLVSFEHHHRIWVYPETDAEGPVPAAMPPVAMAANEGMEGLAAAPAVAGDAYWVGVEPGGVWLCRISASCREINGLPAPPPGFRLSSLTVGPGGELVLLHHSYIPGVGSRIVVTVVADPLGAKQFIGGFAMAPSTLTDNFEGVAVVAKPDGDWRLYLLSDDNFNVDQRTLLLAFDWTPPK